MPIEPYYERLSATTYRPAELVSGAWRSDEQHMAPISGLMTQQIARHEARPGMQLGRLSFDILGWIPLQNTTIEVETIRPGRTIELIEATAIIDDRPRIRCRAWRLAQLDDVAEFAGSELTSIPGPEECEPVDLSQIWLTGFVTSLEARLAPGGRPGRRTGWLRTDHPLLPDEPIDDLARSVMVLDVANGLATRVDPKDLMFPNVDLGVHAIRQPAPGWLGLDVAVSFGPDGLGLTSTTLSDEHGPFGRSEQALTVRPFPSADAR